MLHTMEISGGRILEFDAKSELLFIGTEDKIIVFDIKKETILVEIQTPMISAISISPNNDFLVWGDSAGMVHIVKIISN